MIILILPREKLLNFGHEKLGKGMEKVLESHGILKVSKSTNPVVFKKGVSISCTEKYDIVYVCRVAVDSRKTEMMQIQLRQYM